MLPSDMFDLDAGTDVRSVKRRYAQLLKQFRPEDDPEAFQRLRDAYEQALEWVSRGQGASTPVLEKATDATSDITLPRSSLEPAGEPDCAEAKRVRALPDTCGSMSEALAQAREMHQEEVLQLELLRRSQLSGARAIELIRWAVELLNWLTPWQPHYLPATAMAQLAQRLLEHELTLLWEQLPTVTEAVLYENVEALACQKWMQPLELNSQLQQGLIAVLECYQHGSPDLLRQMSALFGWNDRDGFLPCDPERWERLADHLAYTSMWKTLLSQLALPSPQQPKERACWFLFKPMSDAKRRKMADRFEPADWAACEHLAREVERRQPHIPQRMGVEYVANWRQWRHQDWGGWAILYAWLIISVVLMVDQLHQAQSGGETSMYQGLALALIASSFMTVILSQLRRAWAWLARELAHPDVWGSRFLVPPAMFRQGSGLLMLRHVMPAAVFAVLVSAWAQHAPMAITLLLGTLVFVASLCFLHRVTRGALPYAWLIPVARLVSVINWKMFLLWLVIIVGGVLLARLAGPNALKRQAMPADPLTACSRPVGDQQQRDCEWAEKKLRELMAKSRAAD